MIFPHLPVSLATSHLPPLIHPLIFSLAIIYSPSQSTQSPSRQPLWQIFECGQRKIHTIEFSVGNLISFVVSGINITRAQPRPRIWPSASQLRLPLVFCWQQDNGNWQNTLGYSAHKIEQTMTRQEPPRSTAQAQETTDPTRPTSNILRGP